MEISIIIPAYNEEERIAPTIQSIHQFLANLRVRYEIVVVDDGSTDNTVNLVESMRESIRPLRCIPSVENRGKGHAVRIGMLDATGDVRVMCDADGSMAPSELPKLLGRVFDSKADVAIGSRYAAGTGARSDQPGWRVLWSRFANSIIQRSLVAGIEDTQCGYKAFSAKAATAVFSRATIDGWSFDLEVLALAKRLDFQIDEIGVKWVDDERSRVTPILDLFRVVREFLAIRSNFRRGVYGHLESYQAGLQRP